MSSQSPSHPASRRFLEAFIDVGSLTGVAGKCPPMVDYGNFICCFMLCDSVVLELDIRQSVDLTWLLSESSKRNRRKIVKSDLCVTRLYSISNFVH